MTVEQLIRELEGCDPSTEVRLAHQPSWPFEYSVDSIGETDPDRGYENVRGDYDGPGWYVIKDAWLEEDGDGPAGPFETSAEAEAFAAQEKEADGQGNEPVVYIGEGTQLGYLRGSARKALGWS